MTNAKRKKTVNNRTDSEKIDEVLRLLQYSVAIELFKFGSTQQQIAKALGIATASVNKMLQGLKKQ